MVNRSHGKGRSLWASREGGKKLNAEELRARQLPIKERYKQDSAMALFKLKAAGEIDTQRLTCTVNTPCGKVEAGLHPAAGGDGLAACSGEMLLEALASCAGVTLSIVATALGISVRGGTVNVDGDLDFRGTLGVSKETPVGFTAIRIRFELDTDADSTQLDNLIRLTERYCVVFQTLKNPPVFEVGRSLAKVTPI